MTFRWHVDLEGTCFVVASAILLFVGCKSEEPTGVSGAPSNVIRGWPNGCVPEVLESSSESTDTVLVTFNTLGNNCYPNLVQWGIDLADPMGVDTPQGDNAFIATGDYMANMPPSPALSDVPARAARLLSYSPPQVMIEFDPPVQTVEFFYSRLQGERAYWNGVFMEHVDSMGVYAMSRWPGTTFMTHGTVRCSTRMSPPPPRHGAYGRLSSSQRTETRFNGCGLMAAPRSIT
jgi:hypothetical protein